jgi:Terminase RNaseH-like domain
VGGIDFGFRNPFAAVWGMLDGDGVLWLTGEHYARARPLSYHAERLPRDVMWHCDPSGAADRAELVCADFKVREAPNAVRPGIAAVMARLESGTLRVQAGRCPNLLAEADLYRYDDAAAGSESPVSAHDHALDALRYLIYSLDYHRLARPRPSGPKPPPKPPRPPTIWEMMKMEHLWTRIY